MLFQWLQYLHIISKSGIDKIIEYSRSTKFKIKYVMVDGDPGYNERYEFFFNLIPLRTQDLSNQNYIRFPCSCHTINLVIKNVLGDNYLLF